MKPLVIGNSLAAIVALEEFKNKNQKVSWVDTGGPAGGIFGGMKWQDGTITDVGMNLLEFTQLRSPNTHSDVFLYQPDNRADLPRFFPIVQKWIEARVEVQQVDTPLQYWRGITTLDLLIANEPECLQLLPHMIQQEILASLSIPEDDLHARNKFNTPEGIIPPTYAQMGEANHGSWLQKNLMDPWVEKNIRISSNELPGRYHRVAWAPLFYPETLKAFLTDKSFRLSPTLFAYPTLERFGAWMDKLYYQFIQTPTIQYFQGHPLQLNKNAQGWEVHIGKEVISTPHIIWTGSLLSFASAVGEKEIPVFEQTGWHWIKLTWNRKHLIRNFSVLNIPEIEIPVTRITHLSHTQSSEEITLFAEIPYQDTPDPQRVIETLWKSGLIESEIQPLTILQQSSGPRFVLPYLSQIETWNHFRQTLLDKYSGLTLMGSAAPYNASSFNDQILQGIKAGQFCQ